MSLDEAHGIVAESRAYTIEHFGFSKTSHVGHVPADTFDRAVDRLVSGVAELVHENERLRKVGGLLAASAQECSAYLPLFIGDTTIDDRRTLARAVAAHDRYRTAVDAWKAALTADQPDPTPVTNGPGSSSAPAAPSSTNPSTNPREGAA